MNTNLKTITKVFILAGVLLLAGLSSGCGGWVANVNGKTIEMDKYDRRLEEVKTRYAGSIPSESDNSGFDSFRRSVAEDLVVRELLNEQADQMGITITEADVDKALEDLKNKKFDGDEGKLVQVLRQQGISLAEARLELQQGLLLLTVRNQVTRDIQAPSDDDVKVMYERNPQKYEIAATIKLRQIQLPTEADAVLALNRLNQSEDMAAVARELSLDDLTREQGGDMGWVPRGAMDDDLEQAAFALTPGATTAKPVQSQSGGWHILRMEDFKPSYQRTLDESREMIRQDLLEKSRDSYWTKWLMDLKNNSSIEYNAGYEPLEV